MINVTDSNVPRATSSAIFFYFVESLMRISFFRTFFGAKQTRKKMQLAYQTNIFGIY